MLENPYLNKPGIDYPTHDQLLELRNGVNVMVNGLIYTVNNVHQLTIPGNDNHDYRLARLRARFPGVSLPYLGFNLRIKSPAEAPIGYSSEGIDTNSLEEDHRFRITKILN